MRRGIPNLFKEGTKHRSGLHEAIFRNVDACKQLADITRTSLGPNGEYSILYYNIAAAYMYVNI